MVVNATVTNVGARTGAEVAQLYVRYPGDPFKQLRGFEKMTLAPGASKTMGFSVTARWLSTWDATAHAWRLASGNFFAGVGASVADIRLEGNFTI